jgi:hypothetical protein
MAESLLFCRASLYIPYTVQLRRSSSYRCVFILYVHRLLRAENECRYILKVNLFSRGHAGA